MAKTGPAHRRGTVTKQRTRQDQHHVAGSDSDLGMPSARVVGTAETGTPQTALLFHEWRTQWTRANPRGWPSPTAAQPVIARSLGGEVPTPGKSGEQVCAHPRSATAPKRYPHAQFG